MAAPPFVKLGRISGLGHRGFHPISKRWIPDQVRDDGWGGLCDVIKISTALTESADFPLHPPAQAGLQVSIDGDACFDPDADCDPEKDHPRVQGKQTQHLSILVGLLAFSNKDRERAGRFDLDGLKQMF
jgi:hypothetical protein